MGMCAFEKGGCTVCYEAQDWGVGVGYLFFADRRGGCEGAKALKFSARSTDAVQILDLYFMILRFYGNRTLAQ